MSYIVLNGTESSLIQGLLIQSLPPISKPSIRNTVETIDGRDGDIVTKLGYSAYDKQMSIGLFGDYDIDEVISYFNSEGTVIFSNEPDKFYQYQIIEQIDFEKLLRFKTATVTFHVQPFKYSAVDDAFSVEKNQLHTQPYDFTFNGVTVKSALGVISLTGTAYPVAGFYVPISTMNLTAGAYTIRTKTAGLGMNGVKIRIIKENPTDSETLGGHAIELESGTQTFSVNLNKSKSFHYVFIEVESGNEADFTLTVEVLDEDFDSLKAFNRGNVFSRPKLTLFGSGDIELSINGVKRFDIALGSDEYITLDGAEMNAYKGDVFKNRSVSGDYKNLALNVGENDLSWTGDITKIEVEKVSRWI